MKAQPRQNQDFVSKLTVLKLTFLIVALNINMGANCSGQGKSEQVSNNIVPELVNIPEHHGIALWSHRNLGSTLIECINGNRLTKDTDQLIKDFNLDKMQRTRIEDLLRNAYEIAKREETKIPGCYFEVMEQIVLEGLTDIFNKSQMSRFQELHCQLEGLAILRKIDYAKKLALSHQQQQEIINLVVNCQEKANAHYREIFVLKNQEDAQPHIKALNGLARSLDLDIIAILNQKQRDIWKQMVGKNYNWDHLIVKF